MAHHYTMDDKAKALALLKVNNMDVSKTAKALSIPRNTLRVWRNRYPELINNQGQMELYATMATDKIITSKLNILDKYIADIDKVTGAALAHLLELIPEATIMETTAALKTMADIYKAFGASQEDQDKGDVVNIITQVVNQQLKHD